MRRYLKHEVLGVLDTLKTASSKLKTVFRSGNQELLQNYLTECQEAAIQLGNTIEASGDEGKKAVFCLEEFCELLYRTLSENRDYSKELIYCIKKTVAEINSLPERREVVFLPYKACMWDSLESVWMAARDDDSCDAYVVPIPYYDKNQDGSFGEMHYEGDRYPDYVPVTSWKEYDFANRRPDEIYIHNPYDGWNYVTSVHPSFYAKELKKYTEKLVYIPYFVLCEISPDNQSSIDEMKHLCFLPGIIYADKVIVQSEDMKKIYVNEFMKAAQANGLPADRETLNKKILGLGSPKLDKVRNTRIEELDIPEDWLKIIQRPDGTWKKIVFYNVGISSALYYQQQWVDKIKDVLKVFKENRENVALLWRPHPLIDNTLRSMRPDLLGEYQRIRDRYIEEKWGIYDDTAELDRAVVLSSAFYGDQSSVVAKMRVLEKTVLIENCLINKNQYNYIDTLNCVREGRYLWFAGKNAPGLFSYSIDKKQIEKFIKIDGMVKKDDFFGICKYRHKLVGIPFHADKTFIFDMDTEHIEYVNFNNISGEKGCLFQKAVCKENNIFFFGIHNDFFLQLDMKNYDTEIIVWEKENLFKAHPYFHQDIYELDSHIFIPCTNGCVMEMSMDEKSVIIHSLNLDINFATIQYDGNVFWLSGDKEFIVSWNKQTDEVHSYPVSVPDFGIRNIEYCQNKELFSDSARFGDYIFFSPMCANMFIKLNFKTGNFEKLEIMKEQNVIWEMSGLDDEKVIMYSGCSDVNESRIYNLKEEKYGEKVFNYNVSDGMIPVRFKGVMKENELHNLCEYLKQV